MRETINEEVSVVMYYSGNKRQALPWHLRWRNRDYILDKPSYIHPVKVGDTLHHIFSVVDKEHTLWFRLNLDTSNLHWTLEAVHDGLAH